MKASPYRDDDRPAAGPGDRAGVSAGILTGLPLCILSAFITIGTIIVLVKAI
jgi:hypothetical protein